MIEVNHLSRRFGGFTAVDDLSFTVRPGEVLGFLGPNGAGKSTTMKMIAGFIAPSAGSVSIFGRDVQEQTLAARRLIGPYAALLASWRNTYCRMPPWR